MHDKVKYLLIKSLYDPNNISRLKIQIHQINIFPFIIKNIDKRYNPELANKNNNLLLIII